MLCRGRMKASDWERGEMLELIKRRRSIRRYTKEEVSEEEVRQLLQAAMAAPSADNLQPWRFVVVRDAELRRKLAKVHPWARMAAEAPLVLVVLGDQRVSSHWVEDCSAATQNLLLMASSLGLGAVWVGLSGGSERHVRGMVKAPPNLRALCLVPVGHPAEDKPPRTQYDPAKVYREVMEN